MSVTAKDLETDFHGGAIIDEQGQETPMTEEMIRHALEALAEQADAANDQTSS